MGGRVQSVIKLGELMIIVELHRQDLSVSAIAWRCNLDRKTVLRDIARAGAAGLRATPTTASVAGSIHGISAREDDRLSGIEWRPALEGAEGSWLSEWL